VLVHVKLRGMPFLAIDDFEPQARATLAHATYEFLAGGAADEITLHDNVAAFARIRLRPRVLTDTAAIDTRVTLLGAEHRMPLLLAPVAYQKLVHAEGEVASARAAAKAGVTFVMSTASNSAIEDIAATGVSLWLQLYLQSDREVTRDLIARAENAGTRALCLTVDTPVVGTRNRQARANFSLPPDLPTPHLDVAGRKRLTVVSSEREPITWRDVEWLRSITRLPILLKGIITGDDAALALEHGAAGVIVSNHGARNLDTLPATIDALPEVAARMQGRGVILLDGGVRRGTDVVKAIALGANAVLLGRPYVYALACDGTAGVERAIAILAEELETTMSLLGRASVREIDRRVLWG
jgi:4-hydroxymandelate oxidase